MIIRRLISLGLNCKKSAQNKPIFTAFTTFMEQKRMCLDRLYFVDRVNTKYTTLYTS